jgi:hypothetical protein
MRTVRTKVFKFDELSSEAKEKAINDHINFEIEVMDENTCLIFDKAVKKSEQMQTPWFLGSYIFEYHKDIILESVRSFEFLKDGSLYHNNN